MIEWIATILFLIIIGLVILTFVIRSRFNKINLKYSQVLNSYGKTGSQVAREILQKNKIANVQVLMGGEGKDHYNPRTNVIQLSPSVYNSSSVSAAAIAAHEVGHAIQWGKQELGIKFRDTLAKPVGIISQIGSAFMSIGFMFLIFALLAGNSGAAMAWILIGGVLVYGATSLFQLATLPVEFGASRKAKKQLEQMGYLNTDQEKLGTKKVLRVAAMTYVVAALMTLATLLYFIVIILARRRG